MGSFEHIVEPQQQVELILAEREIASVSLIQFLLSNASILWFLVKYETGHNLALGCPLFEQLLIRHIQSKRGVQRTFRTDIDTL